MESLSSELLCSIIADIYDCVLNPGGWAGVMTRITEAVDAAYTTITLASTADNNGRFTAQSSWDLEQMRVLQRSSEPNELPVYSAAIL